MKEKKPLIIEIIVGIILIGIGIMTSFDYYSNMIFAMGFGLSFSAVTQLIRMIYWQSSAHQEEYEARKKHSVVSWDAEYLCQNAIPENLLPKDFPDKIFITFDVDGLDPSVIPDTGTPVAGGLQWYQALNLAKKAVENRTLIGFDVVELAPREDSVLSDFITAQLTYALMDLV